MSSTDQTINIPQLILILVLGALAIRYFFYSSNANAPLQGRNGANNLRAREADVERIQQMFPQISRRSIMWDLQRNGGNVVATTERILSGRGLEVPPQSFQPPLPIPASSSAPVSSAATQSKALPPDLITRYNLKAKLAEEAGQLAVSQGAEPEAVGGGKQKQGPAWSQNKGERQALLQKRREDMILAARKKMEAKVATESGQATS